MNSGILSTTKYTQSSNKSRVDESQQYENPSKSIVISTCFGHNWEILVKRFLLTFPLTQREILREKLREIS